MKQKFRIGQKVVYYDRDKDVVAWGSVIGVKSAGIYTLAPFGSYEGFDIGEMWIAKNIKQMVKKVLGKNFIYWKVLEDYLKNHYQERKDK